MERENKIVEEINMKEIDSENIAVWISKGQWDKCVEAGAPAVESLIMALKSLPSSRYNAETRSNIILALGKIRDERAVNVLIPCLSDDCEPPGSNDIYRVGAIAAEALAMIGDARAIEPLAAVLSNQRGPWDKRTKVLWALEKFDDPRALRGINISLRDGNPEVRRMAMVVKKKVKMRLRQGKKWWHFW